VFYHTWEDFEDIRREGGSPPHPWAVPWKERPPVSEKLKALRAAASPELLARHDAMFAEQRRKLNERVNGP
jgi:hypothetical protein